jgi:hypothetical protein
VSDDQLKDALETLAARRTFFGHQSVGANILAGLSDLARERAVALPILEWASGPISAPGIWHAKIGANEQPLSKIGMFVEAMDAGVGSSVQYAFFKFCYVDIVEQTNDLELFEKYRTTLRDLRIKYPKTTFIHMTVPLTVVERGAKAKLKSLVGMKLFGEGENAIRHRYNERLRHEYCGKEPLFDLARLEALRGDGGLETYAYQGKTIPSLAPAYTDDGQHLVDIGRRVVASHLATFLAELPAR